MHHHVPLLVSYHMTKLALPPGRVGAPLLGQTLAVMRDPFGFVDRGFEAHGGSIFRTHLFFRPAVVIAGPEAAELWLDEDRIVREASPPPHMVELFGGVNLSVMDGAPHKERKSMMMAAFGRAALEDYLPRIDAIVTRRLAAAAQKEQFAGIAEFRDLAVESICSCVLGIEDQNELRSLVDDYSELIAGFLAVPIAFPGSRFSKARSAKDRILRRFRAYLETRTGKKGKPSGAADSGVDGSASDTGVGFRDGIERMLKAGMTPDVMAVELHHSVVAGYIVFAHLAGIILRLAHEPKHAAALREEIDAHAGAPITLQTLATQMPQLLHFVLEVKRITPVLPFSFGRARREFEFKGHRVPQGWMVLRAITASNFWTPFAKPREFAPERFDAPRLEHESHPHAYTPQGVGTPLDHKCPGLDLTTLVMQIFTIRLHGGYEIELPSQRLEFDPAAIPPEPRDGLQIRLRKRPAERS